MKPEQFSPAADGTLRWLRPDEGGRQQLPIGPIYAAIAVFMPEETGTISSQPLIQRTEDPVSIIIKFAPGGASADHPSPVEFDFIARDLVKNRLRPGARLIVMEGTRPVAKAEITSVLVRS